jgi:hypothetical protein
VFLEAVVGIIDCHIFSNLLLRTYSTIFTNSTHHNSSTSPHFPANLINMSPLSEALSPQKLFRSPSHRKNNKKNMRRMLSRGGSMTRGGSERRLNPDGSSRKSGKRGGRSSKSDMDEGGIVNKQ